MSRATFLLWIGLLAANANAAQLHATLIDGVITYTAEDGSRRRIDIGEKCSDLWVAPDESVFAFVAIEKSDGFENNGQPFIFASKIYVARRSEHFVPRPVDVTRVRAVQRDWEVFRYPSVSPDGAYVFFYVPTSMAVGGTLFAHRLGTKTDQEIGRGLDYCTLWKGPDAGAILIWQRYLTGSANGDGYAHRCYIAAPGRSEAIGSCAEFELGTAPSSNFPPVTRNGAACARVPR
jgi:hypothetical protein